MEKSYVCENGIVIHNTHTHIHIYVYCLEMFGGQVQLCGKFGKNHAASNTTRSQYIACCDA